MIRITGSDLSLASTGIARADVDPPTDGGPAIVRGTWTGTVRTELAGGSSRIVARCKRIRRVGRQVAEALGSPELLVVEGPAPGLASNRGGHDLTGGWWSVVDRYVYRRGREGDDDPAVLVVAPPTLKLYVAGDGRADKVAMVTAVRRHYGQAFDLPLDATVSDVADAIGLLAIGARFLGCPIDLDHPTRERAMATVRAANHDLEGTA